MHRLHARVSGILCVCLFIPIWFSLQKRAITASLADLYLLSSNGSPEGSETPMFKRRHLTREEKPADLLTRPSASPAPWELMFSGNGDSGHHATLEVPGLCLTGTFIRLFSISQEVIPLDSVYESLYALLVIIPLFSSSSTPSKICCVCLCACVRGVCIKTELPELPYRRKTFPM